MYPRHTISLIIITVILKATAVLATIPEGDDLFGLYTNPDVTGVEFIDTSPGTFVIYFCLTGCTSPGGVWGYECLMAMLPPGILTLINTEYNGQAINVATPPEYSVGLATPLPWADVIRLATLTFFCAAITPTYIYMHPTTLPSIPGFMMYVDGSEVGNLIPTGWSSGDESLPVFGVNTGPLFGEGTITVDPNPVNRPGIAGDSIL